jgi:hypothetical protein
MTYSQIKDSLLTFGYGCKRHAIHPFTGRTVYCHTFPNQSGGGHMYHADLESLRTWEAAVRRNREWEAD